MYKRKFDNIINRMKSGSDMLYSWILTVVPRIVCIVFFVYPLRIPSEEVFLFALPAKLMGLDWSPAMRSYLYYGYGLAVLFAPLFRLIENSIVLYKMMLIITALIEGLTPIICCYLLKNFFNSNNKRINIVISILVTYAVRPNAVDMNNEHIYTVCVWICFLLIAQMYKYEKYPKRKFLYSIFLGVTFVYLLTTHKRAVTLVLAFIVLNICTLILFKRKIGYIIPVLLVYYIGAQLDKHFCSWMIPYATGSANIASEGVVANTYVEHSLLLPLFYDKDYLRAAISIIIAQINNFNFFTGGMAVFSIMLGCVLLFQFFQKGRDESLFLILIFGIFGILCVGITMFGQATSSWGWGVKEAYLNNNNSEYSLKAFTYIRYFMPYFPPVMMAVLAYIYRNDSVIIYRVIRYSLIVSGILCSFWLKWLVPWIQTDRFVLVNGLSFIPFSQKDVSARDYFFVVFIALIVYAMFCILYKKKQYVLAFMAIASLTVCQYMVRTFADGVAIERYHYEYINGTTELIKDMKSKKVNCDIYIRNSRLETGAVLLHELQFMNMNEKIFSGKPEEDKTNIIYVTIEPEEDKGLLNQGYKLYQLDDNEYTYIKGDSVSVFFDEMGKEQINYN